MRLARSLSAADPIELMRLAASLARKAAQNQARWPLRRPRDKTAFYGPIRGISGHNFSSMPRAMFSRRALRLFAPDVFDTVKVRVITRHHVDSLAFHLGYRQGILEIEKLISGVKVQGSEAASLMGEL